MAGPFKVTAQTLTFKSADRQPLACGPVIKGVNAFVDEKPAQVLVNKGLSDNDKDRLLEHDTSEAAMWTGKKEEIKDGIIFDLGQLRPLETIAIWNYNLPNYTSCGLGRMDISVWTEQEGWKTIQKSVEIPQAEGSTDYDEPAVVTLKSVVAQKVRFENLAGLNNGSDIGLSEVRFFEPRGYTACNPEPEKGATLSASSRVKLAWIPGKDAVGHDIYAGDSPDSLVLLGRTMETSAELTGLISGSCCCWRIDEIRADETMTKGDVWDFAIEQGKLAAEWTFDSVAENKTADVSGKLFAELKNNSKWLEKDGDRSGVIELDGSGACLNAPALKLKTNTATIAAWVYLNGIQKSYTGVVFSRAKSAFGLNFTNGNELGYHWNASPGTWGFASGIVVPQDKWVFISVSVEPEKATLNLYEDGNLKTAVNELNHEPEVFDSSLIIGMDTESSPSRAFKGKIDDVRIYNFCLNDDQIKAAAQNHSIEPARAESAIALVNTKLVEPGRKLVQVEKQAEAEQKAVSEESSEQPKKKLNVIPVLVIVGLILVIAVIAGVRKK